MQVAPDKVNEQILPLTSVGNMTLSTPLFWHYETHFWVSDHQKYKIINSCSFQPLFVVGHWSEQKWEMNTPHLKLTKALELVVESGVNSSHLVPEPISFTTMRYRLADRDLSDAYISINANLSHYFNMHSVPP